MAPLKENLYSMDSKQMLSTNKFPTGGNIEVIEITFFGQVFTDFMNDFITKLFYI